MPGSASDDVSIAWGAVDPRWDTHDDVRVASITRSGVTADYQVETEYPFGKYRQLQEGNVPHEVDPSSPSRGGGMTQYSVTEPVMSIRYEYDENTNTVTGFVSWSNSVISAPAIAEPVMHPTPEAPPDDYQNSLLAGLGVQIYDLKIEMSVDGQLLSSSRTHNPYTSDNRARRRLLHVKKYPNDTAVQTTEFLTNHLEEVAGIVHPNGNSEVNGYDLRGNLITVAISPKPDPATGEPSGPILETHLTYEPDCFDETRARCNKPLTITDPAGNVTEYTYNDRGQLLTETGPAPTPGAARPTTRHEYTERTAWILDGSGGLVPAGQPISLLTRTSQCLTTENCVGTTDEVVTEYDYGPIPAPGAEYATNLLLRGVAVTAADANGQMQTLRTCYSYNYFGEKVSETSPRADLQVCP